MYFGNNPLSASYLTDYFSGNNTTVAFTLSRAPVSASSVIITISGVKQAASTYGVSGTTLTFSAAPPTGTNNIEVLHLGVQPDTVVQPSYRTITEFTATAGQTTFSPASYTVGYIDVYRNGVKLGTADFTATNGTSVVLANACAAGDYVRFEGFLITSFNNAIANTNGAVGDSLIASVSASKLTGSRTLPNTVVPAGSVIQVVNGTVNYVTTTSASLVDTGLSASITPSASSSKILVSVNLVSINPAFSGSANWAFVLTDGSNNTIQNLTNYNSSTGTSSLQSSAYSLLLSPSTTSSITYKVRFSVSGGNSLRLGDYSANFNPSTITLMEIAA
jgi:hypothetical protein